MAPNLLKITNISILVVPNTPTTRMLILLILIILPATPFPLSQHSTPLLFPHAIPLIPAFHTAPIPARHSPYPSIPHHSCSRKSFPLSPSIPHHSYSRTPFPLSPSIPHHLLFPHAILLIPAFHTAPIPARQTPLITRSQILSKHPRIPCLTTIPTCSLWRPWPA